MARPTLLVGPGSFLFLPAIDYSQVQISDNASVINILFNGNTTNFYFLSGTGSLNTLGAPFFQGSISNFQAGDDIILQDVPSWTSFAYDPAAESLNFLNGSSVVASLTVSEQVIGQYSTSSFQVGQTTPAFVPITTSAGAVAPSVAVASTYAASVVTATPGVEQVTAAGITTNALLGQSLQFSDGTLSFDRAAFEPAATQLPTLFRLYETALGRAPDTFGENSWNALVNHGLSLETIANDFLGSDEFQISASGLSNADFLRHLYQDGLGRAPEPGGLQYWTDALSGGVSRADVLLDVSQSAEGTAYNTQVARSGVFTPHA